MPLRHSAELNYILDINYMETFIKNASMSKTAQDAMGTIAQDMKQYVAEHWDSNHIAGSILGFFAPGVLWGLNPMFAIFYEVSELFGFKWGPFWNEVAEGLESFIKGMVSSGQPVSEEAITQQVQSVTSEAADKHFQDESPDTIDYNALGKLKELAKHSLGLEKQDSYNNKQIIKTAGFLSILFNPLKKFFLWAIPWLLKKMLTGVALTAGVGAAKSLLGLKDDKEQSNQPSQQSEVQQPIIPLPSSAPRSLLAFHQNNVSSSWVEVGGPNRIEDAITQWILSAYPQLQKYISDIESSNVFHSVWNKFNMRNQNSHNADFFVVPPPYQRKIDVVSEIVNAFVKEHMELLN